MLHLQFSKKFNTKPEEGVREKVEGREKKPACEVATLDTDNPPTKKKKLGGMRQKKKEEEINNTRQ